MEIRINVEDRFMRRLKDSLKVKTTEIVRSALTLLGWAAQEVKRGRVILSTDSQGNNIHRLAMPTLEAIRLQSESKESDQVEKTPIKAAHRERQRKSSEKEQPKQSFLSQDDRPDLTIT